SDSPLLHDYNALVVEGNKAVYIVQMNVAFQKYLGARASLDRLALNPLEREQAEEAINALHVKLALYRALRRCHEAMDSRDRDGLQQAMIDVKRLVSMVDVSSKLFEKASKEYSFFASSL
ncbi:MAG: hypothetical protein ABIA93_01115, partial [Candidatus Woesearchaeota archaeon]